MTAWQSILQRLKSVTTRIKLPGWAMFLLGVLIDIPDWKSRFDFWIAVTPDMYWVFKMVSSIAPYLSPLLIVIGFAYILFVGEPEKGVTRHPALPYVGWGFFGICLALIVSAYLISAAESKKLQLEVVKGWGAAADASHELLKRDIADHLNNNCPPPKPKPQGH